MAARLKNTSLISELDKLTDLISSVLHIRSERVAITSMFQFTSRTFSPHNYHSRFNSTIIQINKCVDLVLP